MRETGQEQAVLISGESGAGKTESTKLVLSYIAEVAGSSGEEDVASKIVNTNPVMEAFGNAKTERNNNSSRFGKWIDLQFKERNGGLVGAKITDYLLEISRVGYQGPGERNYHVFYQVFGDAKKYQLQEPENYDYLKDSYLDPVPGIDDESEYRELNDALTSLG